VSSDQRLRVCSRCHAAKPLSEFPIKDKQRGTLRSYCRPCCSEYGKEHYRKNAGVYTARARARAAIDRPRNREYVATFLKTHPCVDCGEGDPIVLEFDHRDPTTKRDDVGRLMHMANLTAVVAEVEKCDVRCGNCHRIRTATQFGSYRLGEEILAYFS
jgi:hypothetical protein